MRRIIRSVETHEYFRWGQWTPNPGLAQHFPDSGKVIDTCLRYHLHDVELVLQLNDEPAEGFDTHVRLFDFTSRSNPVNSRLRAGNG